MAQADRTTVRGTCAPRFELVRQEFERNFAERGESGAAVAIIVDGETVVDLWAAPLTWNRAAPGSKTPRWSSWGAPDLPDCGSL
jgi:CubicO group peptidase (beta-lactamase class C family)